MTTSGALWSGRLILAALLALGPLGPRPGPGGALPLLACPVGVAELLVQRRDPTIVVPVSRRPGRSGVEQGRREVLEGPNEPSRGELQRPAFEHSAGTMASPELVSAHRTLWATPALRQVSALPQHVRLEDRQLPPIRSRRLVGEAEGAARATWKAGPAKPPVGAARLTALVQ
jgi:hypothetical protein